MADLRSTYLGFELANPLVASASPLSKQLDSARHLEDAGASALVMYSLFEEQLLAEEQQFERFMHHQALGHGEAQSFLPDQPGFQSSLDQYLEQLQSLKAHLGIPVIASLNGISEHGWVNYGRDLQDAGADALEINVYYVAADISESAEDVERRYLDVLVHLVHRLPDQSELHHRTVILDETRCTSPAISTRRARMQSSSSTAFTRATST